MVIVVPAAAVVVATIDGAKGRQDVFNLLKRIRHPIVMVNKHVDIDRIH
jgi:hypothetical protein